MRLPVGIDILILLVEVARRRELVFAYLWRFAQGVLRGGEHEQVQVRGNLKGRPGNRDIFFINAEDPAPAITT